MCWCVCDYWQEGSLTFQRRVTGFAEKHFTSPHRAVASGFSASPSSSQLQMFHTCISWHNLSRLPLLLTSSISEIEVIPQPLGSPLLPSFTWGRLFIRRFCELGFGFWRGAALYDPWRPSFTSRHCDPLFWPFQLFLFFDVFHFCFIFVFEPSLFLTSGFSSSVFLFCHHLLLFDRFSLYVMNFFLLGLFFFMSFFLFPVVYLLVFPSWNHFSFFLKNLFVSCLFLSLPFSLCFDLSTKYLVSFAQFFLFPFFLFSLFSCQKKKMGDGLMQRMSRGRDQWQLIVHRLHSLNNVTARGSDQESFQSPNAIFHAYEKSGSPGNKKFVFFHILFEKKNYPNEWKKNHVSNCFEKKRFQTRHSFSKRMDNKNKRITMTIQNLVCFLWSSDLLCDTDSPWVIRQWMLSIIYICSLSPFLLSLCLPSFLNTWRQVTSKIGQLEAVKPRDGTFTKIFEDMRIAKKITCFSHRKINKYPVNSRQVRKNTIDCNILSCEVRLCNRKCVREKTGKQQSFLHRHPWKSDSKRWICLAQVHRCWHLQP